LRISGPSSTSGLFLEYMSHFKLFTDGKQRHRVTPDYARANFGNVGFGCRLIKERF
jgi:hypothetical protein